MSEFYGGERVDPANHLKKWIAAIGTGIAAMSMSACTEEEKGVTEGVHESRYHVAFPLQKGGEKIDVLVRVEKTNRAYGFYLVLVENRSWSWEKKDELNRIYQGWVGKDVGTTPYPVKVRLQIDSADGNNDVHIDRVVTERSPHFDRYVNNDTEIWRAGRLYFHAFPPGIYRVRLENLEPVPQIDFETLFAFEKDTRKY